MEDWFDSLTIADLPPGMRQIAEIVGMEPTLKLCRTYPGIPLSLPMFTTALRWVSNPDTAHRMKDFRLIANVIGQEKAMALADYFNGTVLYVPKLDEVLRNRKHELIREDRRKGVPYRDIALKYNISDRWVREIVDHQEDKQLSFAL